LEAEQCQQLLEWEDCYNTLEWSLGCDLKPYLLTVTSYDDGRPDSTHKSRIGEITWRTCHDRFSGRRGAVGYW
jgi:hypothetical protein